MNFIEMTDPKHVNYKRIESAITYIHDNFKEQPSLKEIAAAIHISPFHFQRMFVEWAGVSPKKFMQYLSLEYAKRLLQNEGSSLLDTAHETGLSGPSRLHDLFINIESMTPGEYKKGGAGLNIHYEFAHSPFGKVIIASTHKGVCHMSFIEDEISALSELKTRFPQATFQKISDQFQQNALLIFQKDWQELDQIKLHLAGTPFQIKVWESLLQIPMGALSTYGKIAHDIDKPKASRAVGTAIGANPVSFLIPCHRVIQQSGKIGGYRWGTPRKTAMIGWEAAQDNH